MAGDIVRRVDDLGRVVIPKESRDGLGWTERQPVKIWREGSRVLIEAEVSACRLCDGEVDDARLSMGDALICGPCVQAIKAINASS